MSLIGCPGFLAGDAEKREHILLSAGIHVPGKFPFRDVHCGCAENCRCATLECCKAAKHLSKAKDALHASGNHKAAAKINKLQAELASKEKELHKVPKGTHELVVSLQKKAAHMESEAISEADTAASLANHIAAEADPSVEDLAAAAKAAAKARTEMKEANAAKSMAHHAEDNVNNGEHSHVTFESLGLAAPATLLETTPVLTSGDW